MNKTLSATLFTALILVSVGCEPSAPPYKQPIAKPLSKQEEAFLKQLEAVPQAQRQKFILDNRTVVMGMARGNKSFGERLDADLKPPATGK